MFDVGLGSMEFGFSNCCLGIADCVAYSCSSDYLWVGRLSAVWSWLIALVLVDLCWVFVVGIVLVMSFRVAWVCLVVCGLCSYDVLRWVWL